MPDIDASKTTLGSTLADVRTLRGASLKAIAEPAGISASYLQKLERDQVKDPSPRVLQRLARQLDVPYQSLMSLAGYLVARDESPTAQPATRRGALSHALSSETLTEEEAAALSDYLQMLRQRERRRARAR